MFVYDQCQYHEPNIKDLNEKNYASPVVIRATMSVSGHAGQQRVVKRLVHVDDLVRERVLVYLSSCKLISDRAVLTTMPRPGVPRHLVYAVAIDMRYPPEWGIRISSVSYADGEYTVYLAYFSTLEDARRFARSVYRLFSVAVIRRDRFYVDSVHVARVSAVTPDPDLPRFQL